jgi:hypothetical protein
VGPTSVTLCALRLAAAIGRVNRTISGVCPETSVASAAGELPCSAGGAAADAREAIVARSLDRDGGESATVNTAPTQTATPATATRRAVLDARDGFVMARFVVVLVLATGDFIGTLLPG